jgi:hypothetical protein
MRDMLLTRHRAFWMLLVLKLLALDEIFASHTRNLFLECC